MGFSRQEYWAALPFPSPGDPPDPGIEPRSLALQADSLKNAMQETWVQSLGQKDPLEKGKATHSSDSGLENSMDCIVHGVAKSRTQLSDFHFTPLLYHLSHQGI